jgi:hypothetical protein
LAALGVSQPLLDLFGRSPEYFVANDVSRGRIMAWAATVALGPALVLVVLVVGAHLVHPRFGRVVHRTGVFVLALVAALALLRPRDWAVDADVWFIGLLVAAIVWRLEHRRPAVHRALCYLAVLPVVLLGLFLGTSATGELVRGGEVERLALIQEPEPVPVVLIVLDELPLSSLLDENLQIDASRTPNLARLAAVSTFYRNASAVSADTTQAVPAVLAGTTPDVDLLPIAADHPRSIFTLTEETHVPHVREAITRVCPARVCGDMPAGAEERASSLWSDTAVVLGHLVLPRGPRADLPRIDRAWGGFTGAGDAAADDEDATDVIAEGTWSPPGEIAATRAWIDGIPDDEPLLGVLHLLLPHAPWQTAPSGRLTPAGPALTDVSGVWFDDERVRRHGLQRHLLQLGGTDRLLGELFDALEARGLWDDAVIVLVADHGANFGPGHQRTPTPASAHEVLRVPLFIHAPGQIEGSVDDRPVSTLDVLPTIAGLLRVDAASVGLPGRDLGAETGRGRPATLPGSEIALPGGLDALRALVERNRAMLGSGAGWDAVLGVGPIDGLLGDPVGALAPGDVSGSVEIDQVLSVSAQQVPTVLSGTLGVAAPQGDVVVAVGGRLAGAGVVLDEADGTFVVVVDERLWPDGPADVEVLVRGSGGGWLRLTATPP